VGGSADPHFTLAALEGETACFENDLTKRNYNQYLLCILFFPRNWLMTNFFSGHLIL
jgi:hypothetical protein